MTTILESLLLNRRAVVLTLVGSLLAVLLSYNLASFIFLQQFEQNLDNALGTRLQSVADVVARLLERALPETEIVETIPPNSQLLYQLTLNEIRTANQLQAIYLVTPDYRTLVSIPEGNFQTGDNILYLREDSTEFALALRGLSAFSKLHDVAGNKFKSGYAPIRNLAGQVIAVLVVEASADFFSVLDNFQNGLYLGIFFSLIVVILYGAFIGWIVSYFVKLQDTARRNEKLAAMGQMAATVAHEIRNPLGIIKSTSEVLNDLVQPQGKQKELFDFIPAEVDRLNRLVNDFLTFARDKALKMETQDLVATVTKAVSDLQQDCKDESLEIVLKTEQPSLNVPHNPDAIRQVVLNLVMNAVQAMEGRGCVELTVRQKTQKGKHMVDIEVSDSGPGIAGDASKIFEPFYTTKTSGSGLGLAITRQIVEKHHGTIRTASGPSGGLQVTITIPA